MRVFLTGATGYIGNAVAMAFRGAGHEVWGLCRSAEKMAALARQEIHPVAGDLGRPQSYAAAAAECSVLVHAAADLQAGMVGPDRATLDAFLAAARTGSQPKTLVYTSGVWVYGDTGAPPVDETTPLKPARAVAWRPAHEQLVLQAAGARGLVLRPGCVYGRQAGLTGNWFAGAHREKVVRVIGDGRNRWAMVHVDDLADAYVRAAESDLAGEVFNVTDRSRDTVGEMAAAAGAAAGITAPLEHVPLEAAARKMGDFAEALTLDQHVDSGKAVRRLGWQPRHGGFVDGVATYFEAWKAHQAT
ncbi:MAG TPA: NAD-dependent epimerase/dehydratase family protein [Vicinamibacteria bacterium]|nr:NAD-dependent epimerase/dehydratase family protein [Vicinamibacteria bacterium]